MDLAADIPVEPEFLTSLPTGECQGQVAIGYIRAVTNHLLVYKNPLD